MGNTRKKAIGLDADQVFLSKIWKVVRAPRRHVVGAVRGGEEGGPRMRPEKKLGAY